MFYEALNPESRVAKLMFKVKIFVMGSLTAILMGVNGYITLTEPEVRILVLRTTTINNY